MTREHIRFAEKCERSLGGKTLKNLERRIIRRMNAVRKHSVGVSSLKRAKARGVTRAGSPCRRIGRGRTIARFILLAQGAGRNTIRASARTPSYTTSRENRGLRSRPADLQGMVGDGGGAASACEAACAKLDQVGTSKADVLIDGRTTPSRTNRPRRGRDRDAPARSACRRYTKHHHQYKRYRQQTEDCSPAPGRRELGGRQKYGLGTHHRAANPNNVVWDLGRAPYDPEDCYISELVACLSEISEGITTGTDTSQSSHTPEHTDAMIKGLMDSGRRSVYACTGGINRSGEGIPYEFPGAMNDTTKGIGRIAKTYFSSKDQW